MKTIASRLLCLLLPLLLKPLVAATVVNVYAWGNAIPSSVIHQFEQQTGIKVNYSTYDSNETMYAKLRASHNSLYDVILPSTYYVERMKRLGLLTPLNHHSLPNLHNLDAWFTELDYDKNNQYSIPLMWGTTGIFYNRHKIANPPYSWKDLWDPRWHQQLLLLDDAREVFAMALMKLGFNPNDTDPKHIEAAFQQLLTLVPNIKLFASDSIKTIMIDEDAFLGLVWNGETFKAQAENKALDYIYPSDGFVIWIDCLAIPHNPPHLKEAYTFINFLLIPEIARQIALVEGHAITNKPGRLLLPETVRDNPIVYPSAETLKRGHLQRDVGEETVDLYNQYWQQFKLAF